MPTTNSLLNYSSSYLLFAKLSTSLFFVSKESLFSVFWSFFINWKFFRLVETVNGLQSSKYIFSEILNISQRAAAWKVSKYGEIRSSGPCFPAFGLNMERYWVSLRIQSKCGDIRTRKKPGFGHLSRSVSLFGVLLSPRIVFRKALYYGYSDREPQRSTAGITTATTTTAKREKVNSIYIAFDLNGCIFLKNRKFFAKICQLQNLSNIKIFTKLLESKLDSLHKKWSFPLRISSVNVTKSAVSCFNILSSI